MNIKSNVLKNEIGRHNFSDKELRLKVISEAIADVLHGDTGVAKLNFIRVVATRDEVVERIKRFALLNDEDKQAIMETYDGDEQGAEAALRMGY